MSKIPWVRYMFFAGVVVFVHLNLHQYAFDDAYIHFRIARNFVETGAPYFNLGEITKVSTSSGWIIFITLVYASARLVNFSDHIPVIMSVINSLATVGCILVYTQIIKRVFRGRFTILLQLVFQVSFTALLLPSSVGLMEIPLALLLVGLGILLINRSRLSGFVILGAAPFFRVELFVVLFLLVVFIAVHRKDSSLKIIGYAALGFFPLLTFDLSFFHTAVPFSVIAKSTVYSEGFFIAPVKMLVNSSPQVGLTKPTFLMLNAGVVLCAVILTAITAWIEWKERNDIYPLLFSAWGLLIAGAYVLGKALLFDWYIPLYTIPFLVAVVLCSKLKAYPRNRVIMIFQIFIFLQSIISLERTIEASALDPSKFTLFETGARVKTYLMVGNALYQEYPDALILTSEIGGLGYTFRGKIVDAAGLASPDALKYHPMKIPEQRSAGWIGAIPPDFVKQTRPEIIVSYDIFAEALLKDEVIKQYRVFSIPAITEDDLPYSKSKMIWGSLYLRVLIRKDLPVSEKLNAILSQ